MPNRAAAAARRCGRRPYFHRRQLGGGTRGGVWRRDGLRLVSDHTLIFSRRCLHGPLQAAARRSRDQAEQVCDPASRGRARLDRRRHRRCLERSARLHRHIGSGNFIDAGIPRACLFRRNSCGRLRRAARRALDRHADPHPAVRPHLVRLCIAWRHEARAAVSRRSRRDL